MSHHAENLRFRFQIGQVNNPRSFARVQLHNDPNVRSEISGQSGSNVEIGSVAIKIAQSVPTDALDIALGPLLGGGYSDLLAQGIVQEYINGNDRWIKVGYKAEYRDGAILNPKAIGDPIIADPTQGLGTKVEVSEIFFNNLIRRAELNFNRDCEVIARMVWKFSLYYKHVQFNVARNGNLLYKNEHLEDEKSYLVMHINKQELTKIPEVEFVFENRTMQTEGLQVQLLVSDAQVETHRKTTVVFVNGRLCKIEDIKKMIALAFRNVRFSINQTSRHFICYLSLKVDMSMSSNLVDVNSCPKKQNLVLRQSHELMEMLRLWIEKLLRTNRSAISLKAPTSRNSREKGLFDTGSILPGCNQPEMTGPVIERSDPQRIRLSNAFSHRRNTGEGPIETVTNHIPADWKRQFLKPLVDDHQQLFDFFKKVELVGLFDPTNLVIQYEGMLLLFDSSKLVADVLAYKLMISEEYVVNGVDKIDLEAEIPLMIKRAQDLDMIDISGDRSNVQVERDILELFLDNEGIINKFGAKIMHEGTQQDQKHYLTISRLEFMDFLDFYPTGYLLMLVKILQTIAKTQLTLEAQQRILEVASQFWQLNLCIPLKDSSAHDLVQLKVYYEWVLLELKREIVCAKIDFAALVQPIVDLELTYKTFERC